MRRPALQSPDRHLEAGPYGWRSGTELELPGVAEVHGEDVCGAGCEWQDKHHSGDLCRGGDEDLPDRCVDDHGCGDGKPYDVSVCEQEQDGVADAGYVHVSAPMTLGRKAAARTV